MSKRIPHSQVANVDWTLWQSDEGTYSSDSVQRAILLDIRAELQHINRVLNCANFLAIPAKLERIRINTATPRKTKEKKK